MKIQRKRRNEPIKTNGLSGHMYDASEWLSAMHLWSDASGPVHVACRC